MRRLWWLTCLVGAVGCQCGTPDGALKVVVKVDPTQKVTCAVLELSDGSTTLQTLELDRDDGERVVGIKQGELPSDIVLKARGFISTTGGCATPRDFNGESAPVNATFPKSGIQTVEVTIAPPPVALDADRDGYVAKTQGGTDCRDDDATIHPGAQEACGGSIDLDCNNLAGCSDPACSTALICQRQPDRLVFVTSPLTVDARSCSPVLTVEAQDSQGAVAAQQGLPVVLSATGTGASGVTFYSDANCTTTATSITISQGATRASFYFRSTAGGTTFTAQAAVQGLTPATQVETVTHPPATQLAFSTPPRTQAANACSSPITVELRDAGGVATQSSAAVIVTLAGNPATGLQFFSDAACTTLLSGSAITIGAGSQNATLYAKGTRAGTIALTASATSVTAANQTMTVTPLAATQLRFTSSAQGIATATCSAPVTLEAQDVYANASPVSAALTINLSANPAAGFGFYSDANCSTAITQATIAANSAQATLYFKGSAAGTIVMTAGSSLGNDTQNAGIGVGPPAKLTITTGAQTVVAGTCSGIVTVQSRDVSDNPSNITGSALAVTLTPNPATPIQFFSDASCTTQVSGLTIPVAGTTASFYFRSTLAGGVSIAVSSSLATGDTQAETITAATAQVIVFTNTAFTVTASNTTCTGPFTLQSRDQYGNPSNVGGLTSVALSSSPAGVNFFSNSNCTTSAASVNIAAGSSGATFYARSAAANVYTVTAAAGGGLGQTTQIFTVNPDVPNKLAFVPAAQSVTSGGCVSALVQRQDQFNNPVSAGLPQITATLTDTGTASSVTYYTQAACAGGAVNSVDIPASGSGVTVYIRAVVAQAVTVTAASSGLASGTHALTVNPDVATKLVFNKATETVTAGGCTSPALTVQRRDANDNPTTLGGAITVNLASNATAGLTFHSDSGCTTAITGINIAAGASTSANFFIRATRVEPVTVTGSQGGLTPASLSLTVNPAAVSKIVFTPSTQTVTAGACLAVVVERRDAFDNPITTGGNLNVALSSNATGGTTFHTDATCSSANTPTTQIAANTSSVTFYIRATLANASAQTITGDDSGALTNATLALTVNADAPAKLVIIPAAGGMTAGVCSPQLTVQRQDQFNNPVTAGGAITVNLTSDATSNFTFHNANSCAMPATTITSVGIAAGASTSPAFYMRAQVAETVNVTAAGGGLTNGAGTYIVSPAAVNKLVFSPAVMTLSSGQCSGTVSGVTVERRDAFENPITSGGALTVNLTSTATGTFTFFSASNCTTSITSINIPAGASISAPFFFSALKAESVTLTGAGGGLASATLALTVNPGAATKVVFTSAALSTSINVCSSSAATVQIQDANNNPVPATAATPVTLSSNDGTLEFHLVAACGDAAQTQATIPIGQSTASFYIVTPTAGTPTLTAAVTGLTSANQSANITAAATKLVWTNPARTVSGGACSGAAGTFTVQRQDATNNPVTSGGPLTVNLSASGTPGNVTFYSDATCTTAITSINIPGGQSSTANFYVIGNLVATPTLTAAGGSLTNGTQTLTITAGPVARVAFTNPGPQTLAQLACSAAVTVSLQDLGGNNVAAGVARTVDLTGSAGTTTTFYASLANCNAGTSAITSLAYVAADVSKTVFFKAESGASTTLTAASTVPTTLISGTEVETLTPAAPVRLLFNPAPPATVEAGFCQPLTLERQDALSRPTAPNSATAITGITVGAPQGGTGGNLTTQLFSDNTCTTTLGFPTAIPAGASNTVVYAKGRSGDVSGSATASHSYALTPASALTNVASNLVVLPMVRRGTCTLANTTVTCAVAPNLSAISRTILFYQVAADNVSGTDRQADTDMATCSLQLNGSNLAEVVCDRVATGSPLTVNWQTLSFAYPASQGGVTVQHLTTPINTARTQAFQDIAITSSPTASSFVLFAYRDSSGSTPNGNEWWMAELTSTTNLRMSFASNGNINNDANNSANTWVSQVVNWANASVVRATRAGGSTTQFDVSQSTANLSRTFLLNSSRMADVNETGAPEICGRALSGIILNGTTLRFERGCNTASHDIGNISWELVELPDPATPGGASVQRLDAVTIQNTNSGNQAITAVDRTRAVVFMGSQVAGGTALGRTNYTAAGSLGCAQATAAFTGNNSIRLDRLDNCGNTNPSSVATFGVTVLEVNP